jgi:DNA modification methylase/transcriptional regulator with XRE-family HTH domain
MIDKRNLTYPLPCDTIAVLSDENITEPAMDVTTALTEIRSRTNLSQQRLAQILGVSFVSMSRWEHGAGTPSPEQTQKILELYRETDRLSAGETPLETEVGVFSSRGVRRRMETLPLFEALLPDVRLAPAPLPPLIERISLARYFLTSEQQTPSEIVCAHTTPAPTASDPPGAGMSAGKNTYTYDAHTYHTKVPPQGISELLKHYLPDGGLVLDPFAGSGMTGVACRANGYDCILNELSPAACFIASRFVSSVEPARFEAGVRAILRELQDVRETLYTTTCRECGRPTELLYTVWSYRVLCNMCGHEFLLWDHCRRYGERVREHKILGEFPCPACHHVLRKSQLRRTIAEPVLVGYKCCGSRQQEVTHPPDEHDRARIYALEIAAPLAEGFYPRASLPDGVNLRQPKRHGLDRIDRFYTPRNLAALSHIWQAIHRVEDVQVAAHLGFAFTSLYQRVTRLSEFRFWGGSGNTARFNVPFIFNEANVFVTFARKARSIQDHLETTASQYSGKAIVIQNSATALDYLPDETIDLIFTDPPFGANINYSDMNFLWESWLGVFTNTQDEAIVNKVQHKGVDEYRALMTQSFKECYRVLRPGRWMLVVFMNSAQAIWEALRVALLEAGFQIYKADIFDKQHGTFKQFVSENTAGFDLVLHCRKLASRDGAPSRGNATRAVRESILAFLDQIDVSKRISTYLHVDREEEVDFRGLYSEWMAQAILQRDAAVDFSEFRAITKGWLHRS